MASVVITMVVTIASWVTPLPANTVIYGKLVNYGSQNVLEANADWRGYNLAPYWNRCAGALMSPSDLGRVFWTSLDGLQWTGPCLSVDSAAIEDYGALAGSWKEIVEVGGTLNQRLGIEHGAWGYVYVGNCPPISLDAKSALDYDPVLKWIDRPDYYWHPSFYPYPAQVNPRGCWADDPLSRLSMAWLQRHSPN